MYLPNQNLFTYDAVIHTEELRPCLIEPIPKKESALFVLEANNFKFCISTVRLRFAEISKTILKTKA